MKAYANMYYRARMQAAQREPLHASRERTASEIFVSCEALADYETGRTVPPCDVVQKMVEAYNDPDLAIAWPMAPGTEPLLSPKDLAALPLADAPLFP